MEYLILASASPRRFELLSCFGFPLKVIKPQIEEIIESGLTPEEIVKSLAFQKGDSVIKTTDYNNPLISADTIVVLNGAILGKPVDKENASNMMKMLSGQTHQVFTGVSVFYNNKVDTFHVRSDVTFKKLSNKEIFDYCETDEPYDKAGAYAVQGIGSFMVRSINGSYSNVIGLPVSEVIEHFQKLGLLDGLKA
ncbi:MAG TPA: Maf family protein [bacterium]|nr:Maf family protein [bacterium]HPS29121.1 Maf family protein [bacterium]